MISFRDTDFISATARVRALENRIIGEKALRRLAQASGPEELFRVQYLVGMLKVQAQAGQQTSQSASQGMESLLRQQG